MDRLTKKLKKAAIPPTATPRRSCRSARPVMGVTPVLMEQVQEMSR